MILNRLAPMTAIGVAVALGCASTPPADDPDPPASMSVATTAPTVGYDGIPRNAMRVSSGRAILRFRAARDGTVWIGDDDTERQLLKLTVERHDVVEVNPYTDRIRVNHHIVATIDMDDTHRRSIFHLDARRQPRRD